jgi:hypothetical protein
MNRSKKLPVAPSARNHCTDGAVTPALLWPAANDCPARVAYIARSTMMGSVALMTAETSVASSGGPSPSIGIVRRELGASS